MSDNPQQGMSKQLSSDDSYYRDAQLLSVANKPQAFSFIIKHITWLKK